MWLFEGMLLPARSTTHSTSQFSPLLYQLRSGPLRHPNGVTVRREEKKKQLQPFPGYFFFDRSCVRRSKLTWRDVTWRDVTSHWTDRWSSTVVKLTSHITDNNRSIIITYSTHDRKERTTVPTTQAVVGFCVCRAHDATHSQLSLTLVSSKYYFMFTVST